MFKFKDGYLEFIDPCSCNAWVATAVIGAGVLGAGATIFGANKAADAQTQAAQTAANTSKEMYNTTRGDLAPFRDIGTTAGKELTTKLSDLTSPISVNPQDFLNSDMYKFLQTQGEKAVTNSSAARGLGISGAALKGSSVFESGLNAGQWQQNFNNQVTNQSNAFNRLKSLVDVGENASAQTGVIGSTSAGQQNAATIGAGNAQAAAANATGSSISNLSNNLSGFAMAKGLYGGNSGNPMSNIQVGSQFFPAFT